MHQAGIIRYQAATDRPQLTFLQERVPTESLSIDLVAYRQRKERQAARLKAAVSYAESDICRSQQLVRYFGDKSAERCGICDVCLARKKTPYTQETHQQLRAKIQQLLQERAYDLRKLVDGFRTHEPDEVLQCINYLIDEGFVEKDEAGLLYWPTLDE